jgi:hypothetical protein
MADCVAPKVLRADDSAARSAWRLVTNSAAPSTAVTTNAVPRKILVASGSLKSVPPPLLGIGPAELVHVGLELVAAGVELEIESVNPSDRHPKVSGQFG